MKVARDYLLAVLEAAEPALGSTRSLVPELMCYWFHGDSVTAFNDVLGIRVQFDSDFTGGVDGARLLGILKHLTAGDVYLEARTKGRNPVLFLEAGATGIILPLRPVEEALFIDKFPAIVAHQVDLPFIEAIKLALLSCVTKKLASPPERGVTIIQRHSDMGIFATDEMTVSFVRFEGCPEWFSGRVVWPREFCDYFVRNFVPGTRVVMTDGTVYASGEIKLASDFCAVTVTSRLVDDDIRPDFAALAARYDDAPMFPVPVELTQALQRAAVMLPEKEPLELEVATDGDLCVLRLYANTPVGEFDDTVEIADVGHDDVTVKVDAALLRRALPGRTSLALARGRGVVVLRGPDNFFHFISTKR